MALLFPLKPNVVSIIVAIIPPFVPQQATFRYKTKAD
jgi:hypothetical protein